MDGMKHLVRSSKRPMLGSERVRAWMKYGITPVAARRANRGRAGRADRPGRGRAGRGHMRAGRRAAREHGVPLRQMRWYLRKHGTAPGHTPRYAPRHVLRCIRRNRIDEIALPDDPARHRNEVLPEIYLAVVTPTKTGQRPQGLFAGHPGPLIDGRDHTPGRRLGHAKSDRSDPNFPPRVLLEGLASRNDEIGPKAIHGYGPLQPSVEGLQRRGGHQ